MHHGKRVVLIAAHRFHLPFSQGYVSAGDDARVLVVGADGDVDMSILGAAEITCDARFRPHHDRLVQRGFGVLDDDMQGFDLAIVFLGRHSAENLADIAAAYDRLRPGGWLMIDGLKTSGADSIVRQMRRVLPLGGVLSKSHGKVVWITRTDAVPAIMSEWRDLIALSPNRDGFLTAPGMFSNDATDPGTDFLADHLDPALKGRAADLGAGWGALSALLLRRAPGITSIDLYEADSNALAAARHNVRDMRAAFFWTDVATLPVPDKPYDVIVSNPPFHVTRDADPSVGASFIAAAARLLSPKGRFLMVANRHLPYEEILDKRFRNWSEIATNPRYKVISAGQPRNDQR